MKVITLPVGQLNTNCYLLIDEEMDGTIVIDPGDDGDFITQKIWDEGVKPEAILATHGHFDHVLAVNELKLNFDVPFLMHSRDQFLLNRMRQTTKHFVGFDPGPPPKIDTKLDDLTRLDFGSIQLKIISTPGHTPGSVSFYHELSHNLWVGDVMFANGAEGRTDFDYCSANDLSRSVEKLIELPDQTMVYAGHDENFYLGEEKSYHRREAE